MPHKYSSFVFYSDWFDAITQLEDKSFQLAIYNAVARFALDGEEPEDTSVKTLFNFMRGQIERDKAKYEIQRQQRSNAGKKHKGNQHTRAKEKAEEIGTSVPIRSKNGTNGTVNVNVNDNVNVNVIETTNNINIHEEEIEIVETETIDSTEIIEANIDKIPFETFWDAYDKKNDRKQCEKKWNALSKKKQEKALNGVNIYKANQPNKQYRKDPIRYLRDAMWDNSEICKEIYGDATNNTNTTGINQPIGEGGRRRTQLDTLEAALRQGKG